MMCEHEFIPATKGWMDKDKSMYPISEVMKICKNCRKTVGEIDLEQQLAAAKAELVELKQENQKLEQILHRPYQVLKKFEQQREQIEKQNKDIAKLHEDLIKAISRHKALEDKP